MGFVGELQAFVDTIAAGTAPESNIGQVVHTMESIDAIRASVEAGQPVSL